MESSILVATITSSTSILLAALTFYLTKRHQIKSGWKEKKLDYYKKLLSSLSELAVETTNNEKASENFALIANIICLVASQEVVTALMNFHDYVKWTNKDKTKEKHDELLKKLLLSIRKDIGLSKSDDKKTFNFHLIGAPPKK